MPAPSITSASGVAGSATIHVLTDATSDFNYDGGAEGEFKVKRGATTLNISVLGDVDARSFDLVCDVPLAPGDKLQRIGTGLVYNDDGNLNDYGPTDITFPTPDDIILIGNLAMDSTGKLISGDITGGHDALYSPASGITGVVVKVGSVFHQLDDVTSVDDHIYIALAAGVPASEIPTVSISAASNLTNATGDTPTGQINIAVDNSSNFTTATDIAGSDSKVVKSGFWADGSLFGIDVYYSGAADSQFDIKVTTDADAADILILGYHNSANPYSVSLDGAAYNNPTTPAEGSAMSWVRLKDAVAAGTHTFTTRRLNPVFPQKDKMFRIFGGNATFSAPTVLGTLTAGVTVPNGVQVRIAQTAYIVADGHTGEQANLAGYDWVSEPKHSNASWRARARGTAFTLWGYRNSRQLAIVIDGIQVALPDVPPGGQFGFTLLVTGLTDAFHELEMIDGTPTAGSENSASSFYCTLMVSGGAAPGFDVTYAPAARTTLAAFGDSTSLAADNATPTADGRLTYGFDIHRIKNWATIVDAISGAWASGVFSSSAVNRTQNIKDLTPLDFIVSAHGINDIANGATLGDISTPGTFVGDELTTLNAFLAANPTVIIARLGIIPISTKTWAQLQVFNGGIQDARAASDDPSRVIYIDPAPMALAGAAYHSGGAFVGTNYQDGSVHPNAAGHLIIANYLLSILDPSVFTGRRRIGTASRRMVMA